MSADLLFTQKIAIAPQNNTSGGIFGMFGAQDQAKGDNPAAFLEMFMDAMSENNNGDFTTTDADELVAKLKGNIEHLTSKEKKLLKSFEDIMGQINELLPEDTALEDVDMVSLLAANEELAADVEHFMKSTQALTNEAIEHTLMLNRMALDEIMIPVGGEHEDADLKDKIKTKKEDINLELSNLLSLNLTPQQMAELKAKLEGEAQAAVKDGQPDEAVDALFGAIASIASMMKQQTGMTPTATANASAQTASAMAGMHNAVPGLNKGQGGENAPLFNAEGDIDAQIMKYLDQNFKGGLKASGEVPAGNASFKAALAANDNSAIHSGAAPHLQAGALPPGLDMITNGGLLSEGDTLFGAHDESALFGAGSPNATQMGGMASLVAQAQSAGHPHPATHMVAINIQKAVVKGENTNLTIQLDPPELGRVEVKLHFSKDKTLKASMVVEKPETMLMLQRDAAGLERALQDMGLDTDGGIGFELAEQGFDFDQNNNRGGGHDNGGTGAGGDEAADELIETTMTWLVDPETGHTRYDILV